MKMYVTRVEIVDGQLSIVFPPGFLDKLDLKHDQFLLWEISDEQILIKKKIQTGSKHDAKLDRLDDETTVRGEVL
jgi:hypothetical protein